MNKNVINQVVIPHSMEDWPPPSTAIDFPTYQAWLDANPPLLSTPGSITWEVNGERLLILGWPRAILMQVAHPMIAAGVAQHSVFSQSPVAKLQRFMRTQEQMLRLTYGTPYEVWQAARHIDRIHGRVNGLDVNQQRYTARYPELLKWVHATFVDSILTTYSLFVRPLSPEEKDDYIYKASIIGPLMGAPYGFFPENAAQLDSYLQQMLHSGTLQVGDEARMLADYVLGSVPVLILGSVSSWALKLATGVLLPPSLREAYGLKAQNWKNEMFHLWAATNRPIWRVLPKRIRRWQLARSAENTWK